MKYLVTGAAGFIRMHTCARLLESGHEVVGLDNINTYYAPALKHNRLDKLKNYSNFYKIDLADREGIKKLFEQENFTRVIHLAVQAGVRYSLEAPSDYIDSNLVGMMTILEGCRHNEIEHLVYASSTSIYGMNTKIPFSESDNVDQPVSLYAATKKSNELMAHFYGIPTTGLRFFTVYGPAGRSDMALWLFTEAILNDKPIKVFNDGKMMRDFTYIDDIVEGVVRIQDVIPESNLGAAPYSLFNIGNNQPIQLSEFIESIEKACCKQAEKIYMDMRPGDVPRTFADIDRLETIVGYKPSTSIDKGIDDVVSWYKGFH